VSAAIILIALMLYRLVYGEGMLPKHKKLLLCLFILYLPLSYYFAGISLYLSVISLLVSTVTYLAYAKDKSAAIRDKRRVPEKTLHLLSLFFGWPGAMLAQERLRHKTKKISFRIIFWLTVSLNIVFLGALHSPEAAKFIGTSIVYPYNK